MSQGKKAKVVMAQKTMKDPELVDMFNKMVGASDPDPNIVLPKYNKIYQKTMEVVELLLKFSGSPIMKVFSPQFPRGFLELRQFAQSSIDELKPMELEANDNILSGEELYAINSNPQKMAEFLANINNRFKVAGLGDKYRTLREHPVVKEIIMIARNLKNVIIPEKERTQSQTHDLEIKECLRDGFILNSEGDHLTLFNFTSLDFKQIWYSDLMNEKYRNYILQVLHYIYVRVIDVVREITSPDIDVDKFSEILVKNINEMRKNIPRCDKAFDKIQSSVGLLKGNFGEYYKDFVTSQNTNPGVIVENFVLDVAKKNKADIQTTRQFKQIIDFYRQKMSGRKIDDPKVKKMLSLAGQNIGILEDKLDKKKQPTDE